MIDMANENTHDEPSEVDASVSSHCSLAFADIIAAMTSGKYVTWEQRWGNGYVIGAWIDENGDEWLVMQSGDTEYKPFVSGYAQANVLRYRFAVRGADSSDWAS